MRFSLRSKLLTPIYSSDDIITSDGYLRAFPADYFKTDTMVHGSSMQWRGQHHLPPRVPRALIIAGHSDYPVTDEMCRKYPAKHWFAINTQSLSVRGLPLGLTNDTDESPLHRIYGNVDDLLEAMQQPRSSQNLVYMNFAVDTFPAERGMVWRLFERMSWVTVGRAVPSRHGRRRFLSDIRNHSFVLCPRGNGVDTHRLWETLYLGSIPIVKVDVAHKDWPDLPILFVNDWSEITESRLRDEWTRLTTLEWNRSKLKLPYRVEQIASAIRSDVRR